MKPPSGEPRVRVEAHPPERARHGRPVTLPCACCCCCCCCLHTVGGLVGGIVGSVQALPVQPRAVDPDFPFPFRRDEFDEDGPVLPPTLLYWMLVSLFVVGTALGFYVYQGLDRGRFDPLDLVLGLLLAVMILPGLQLLASLVILLPVALFYQDKGYALRRVGRITLWSFAGMFTGIALMAGCCGILYVAN